MILSNTKEFLDLVIQKLGKIGIDTSELKIDHIGYQASSDNDYDEKKKELAKFGEIKHDVQVGDRRVAIFKLFEPLKYQEQLITAVEIVSPKKDQEIESAWEHIEIVPNEGIEAFMKKYPDLPWDTKRIERDIFPMLILNLGDNLSAKFPKRPVLEEVERIKKNIT
jgi:predicted metalloenzyme YecM